jgi:hypothetical protein
LDIICDDGFSSRSATRTPAPVRDQEDFIFESIDVQIAHHLTFGRDQRRNSPDLLERIHVIRDLAIEEPLAIRAQKAKTAAKAEVQNSRLFAQRGMFREDIAVVPTAS